jgi:hypothetical protein
MYTPKDKIRCVMIVDGWRVEGDVHVVTGSRLTDALNSRSKDYIAVTDAVVYDMTTGEELYRPSYVAVNRLTAGAVLPLE